MTSEACLNLLKGKLLLNVWFLKSFYVIKKSCEPISKTELYNFSIRLLNSEVWCELFLAWENTPRHPFLFLWLPPHTRHVSLKNGPHTYSAVHGLRPHALISQSFNYNKKNAHEDLDWCAAQILTSTTWMTTWSAAAGCGFVLNITEHVSHSAAASA